MKKHDIRFFFVKYFLPSYKTVIALILTNISTIALWCCMVT